MKRGEGGYMVHLLVVFLPDTSIQSVRKKVRYVASAIVSLLSLPRRLDTSDLRLLTQ